jgi:tetratricopeptide (TPR) repeat protein
MKCMNCGAELTESAYCPKCGCDVSVQKQAIVLSGLFYNQGLEKAQVRDLSGAIDQLKRSLKFNKVNISARNLLGLVYFETGEVVAALSEWVISKNIRPEDNIAAEYIENLQKDANRLDVINQTIKKYNIALKNCLDGNEDVAMIQLKKILAQNPKLVKAYHLLALLYIHKEQYEKARRLLKKAIRIDKTNTTTLRFLSEVDEQTGTATALENRFTLLAPKKQRMPEEDSPVSFGGAYDNLQPVVSKRRLPSPKISLVNLLIGALAGAAAIWFLFIPARISNINRAANEKVTKYSSDMAVYSAQIQTLNEEIKKSTDTVNTAKDQIDAANAKATAAENLLKAVDAYNNQSMETAATALASVDSSELSVEAKAVFDSMTSELSSSLVSIYKSDGLKAFENGDYETAAQKLEEARAIDSTDYDVLNYLAHSYRLAGDTENADKIFQLIIDNYPGTAKADNAGKYLSTSSQSAPTGSEEVQDVVNNTSENQTTGTAADNG